MIRRRFYSKTFLKAIQGIRRMSDMSDLRAKSLQYCKFGEPLEVLQLIEEPVKPPKGTQVLVKVLAAPINPSDINTIQGKYPIKPKKLPAIAGHEFVGEVLCVGDKVKSLQVNDNVVASTAGLGTWTTLGLYDEKDLMVIPPNLRLAEAATITVNPCTAYRLLKNFVKLKDGDTVIQNGANSAVGQVVHQLCQTWKISSVGIVRNRPEISKLKTRLKRLGATEIFTEEEIKKTTIFKDGCLKKPTLALNCVGGKSSMELVRHLDRNGVMVTYGGMSMQPVMLGTGPLIFKDIICRGFWISEWSKKNHDSEERKKMFCDLFDLMEKGILSAPDHELVPLSKYKEQAAGALGLKKTGFSGKKIIFDMAC